MWRCLNGDTPRILGSSTEQQCSTTGIPVVANQATFSNPVAVLAGFYFNFLNVKMQHFSLSGAWKPFYAQLQINLSSELLPKSIKRPIVM